jgi:hypothetical protein
VQHRDFPDQQAAQDFAQLLSATEVVHGSTCLTTIRNLTQPPPATQPALPGAEDYPWRACRTPRP